MVNSGTLCYIKRSLSLSWKQSKAEILSAPLLETWKCVDSMVQGPCNVQAAEYGEEDIPGRGTIGAVSPN